MADENEVVGTELNDSELFKGSMSDAPAGETAAPKESTEGSGRPRDEFGRFIPKDDAKPEPKVEAGTPAPAEAPGKDAEVPSWRLREEREAREAAVKRAEAAEREYAEARRRADEMQRHLMELQRPKPEPIDPLADPQGYHNLLTQQFEETRRQDRLEFNLQLAHVRHGKTFEDAYEAFVRAGQSNPTWASSVVNGRNPGEGIVDWYKRDQVLSQVGNDPNAWFEKQLEERIKDPAFFSKLQERQRAAAARTNVTQLPPSLSRISGGGPTETSTDEISEAALFKHATAR